MLCLPALVPVANDAHAVGDSGECVVVSGCMPPWRASFAMFGSLPSPIHRSTRCGSIPSNPRITSFWVYFDGGRRAPPEHAATIAAAPARSASVRTEMCIGKPRNYSVAKGFRRLCYSAEVRALGIDYGERRIGLALSDATGLLASPWKTLPNTADIPRAAAELIEEAGRLVHEADGLSAIVVGLPRRLNGEPTEQTARARQLGDLLASALD